MEIQLVSTDELLDEIFSRFDHIIFCGMKVKIKGNDNYYEKRYEGNYATAIGLCDIVKDHILNDFDEEDVETERI